MLNIFLCVFFFKCMYTYLNEFNYPIVLKNLNFAQKYTNIITSRPFLVIDFNDDAEFRDVELATCSISSSRGSWELRWV